jgi:hypothetical protein
MALELAMWQPTGSRDWLPGIFAAVIIGGLPTNLSHNRAKSAF